MRSFLRPSLVLVLLLSTVFSLRAFAQAQLTDKDLSQFIRNLASKENKTVEAFEENLKGGDVFAKVYKALNSDDPELVVYAIVSASSLSAEITGIQELRLKGLIKKLLKSSNPYIRLVAFQSVFASESTAKNLSKDLTNAISSEQEIAVKRIMDGFVGVLERESTRRAARAEKLQTATIDVARLKNTKIVLTSAVWCPPCVVLKKKMAAENFRMPGAYTFQIRGQTVSIGYETVDIDQQKELGKIYDGPIPTLFIATKDNKPLFSSTLISLDVNGFLKTIEKLAFDQAAVFAEPKVNNAVVNQLLNTKKPSASIVAFWSTGVDASEIPLFSQETTKDIKSYLNSAGKSESEIYTFYGSGKDKFPDTVETLGGFFYKFFKANVGSDFSFTRENLVSSFEAMARQNTSRSMHVFVGHGQPQGFSLWEDDNLMKVEELKKIYSATKSEKVFVSGLCYGGQFASVPRCGFFAARPDKMAAGCWMEEDDKDKVKDYTNTFFSTLLPDKQKIADTDRDGFLTLEEAHWYSVLHGNADDYPYTTSDDFVANEFSKNKNLPIEMTGREAFELKKYLTAAEKVFWSVGEEKSIEAILIGKDNIKIPLKEQTVSFQLHNSHTMVLAIPGLAEASTENKNSSGEFSFNITDALNSKAKRLIEDELKKNLAEDLIKKINLTGLDADAVKISYDEQTRTWQLGVTYKIPQTRDTFTEIKAFKTITPLQDYMKNVAPNLFNLKQAQLLKKLYLRSKKELISNPEKWQDIQDCERQSFTAFIK